MELRRRRRPAIRSRRPEAAATLPVVITGCGMSGSARRHPAAGGGLLRSWSRRNEASAVPGGRNRCRRVDVANHFYCYSFEPADTGPSSSAQQPELQAYFQRVTERTASTSTRRGTEVTGATWDEGTRHLDGRADSGRDLAARAGHQRRGQTQPGTRPTCPAPSTARPSTPPAGTRRSTSPASGSSGRRRHRAFQLVPAIARPGRPPDGDPAHRPGGCSQPELPRARRPGRAVGGAAPALLRGWSASLIFWPGCDKGLLTAQVDPPGSTRRHAVSEINDLTRVMFTDWITSQLEGRPDLVEVRPRLPAHRQAHPAGQRQLAQGAVQAERRARPPASTTSRPTASWTATRCCTRPT